MNGSREFPATTEQSPPRSATLHTHARAREAGLRSTGSPSRSRRLRGRGGVEAAIPAPGAGRPSVADGGSAPRPRTASGGLTVSGSVPRPRFWRNGPRAPARVLRGLAAAALLAAAGLVAAPHQALAQTAFVSNTGQPPQGTGGGIGSTGTARAQQFTTGPQAGGYTLTSVAVRFRNAVSTGSHVSVTINSVDEDGDPDDSALHTLTSPSSITTANKGASFTTTGTVTLAANTSYFVVARISSGSTNLRRTTSDEIDANPSAGWSILSNSHFYTGTQWQASSSSLQIAVYGTAADESNTAPTASNNTVTTDEDTNHVFVVEDFNFSDADAGDTLASVKITTLEAAAG